MSVSLSTMILATVVIALFVLNVYQFLIQRAALRIGEILYVMSRNVRQKAVEVRYSQKDVEIVEAHLLDISTSARGLLRALGRAEEQLGPDPVIELSPNGKSLDSSSLLRLADNVLYATVEASPKSEWNAVLDGALDRFQEKVPKLDRESAGKIIGAVAQQYERDGAGQLAFSQAEAGRG